MNKILNLLPVFVLVLIVVGCDPKGDQVLFRGVPAPGDASRSASSTTKSWKTPQLIDYKVIDGLDYEANTSFFNATTYYPPMFTLPDPNYGFINFHVRHDSSSDARLYAVMPRSFSSQSWLVDGSDQRAINMISAGATAPDAGYIKGVVDANGDTYVIFQTTYAGMIPRMLMIKKSLGSNSWQSAVKLTAGSTMNQTLGSPAAIAANSEAEKVIVWCQKDSSSDYFAYYNFVNSAGDMRFVNETTAAFQKVDAATGIECDNSDAAMVEDLGMDFSFSESGTNGLLAVKTIAGAPSSGITLKRWSGTTDGWSSSVAVATITGVGTLAYPRVHYVSDSAITVFYYEDITGAPMLMKSTGSYSGAFAAGTQVDAGIGAGSVFIRQGAHTTESDYVLPIFSSSSGKAVVGFIKSDGTTRRLYLSRYSDGSWSTPSAIDSSDGVSNLVWADAAINSSGDIVVGYAKDNGATERVFVNYYSSANQSWVGETSADGHSTLVPEATASAMTRPNAAIDASGQAVVSFSMDDSTPTRRAVVITYQ